MKAKITRKTMSQLPNLYRCGYCDVQYLTRGIDPIAYTASVYGWNCDVYQIGTVHICTGYRGMSGERLPNVDEWERKAAEIVTSSKTYAEERERLEALRAELVRALMEG